MKTVFYVNGGELSITIPATLDQDIIQAAFNKPSRDKLSGEYDE